ncbi:hypothetical protein FRB96_000909 [Tulasnella sp. 330]|nr:hypothetical protein FRB96_000909 [Tulasnella sp. 330]KAG8875079.1 hypothetical protein FRB97_005413 [Tulasnella sp. 331]KAG8887533.1 hypothetical protein FRB98_009496 [Tulasnella sp. 332]
MATIVTHAANRVLNLAVIGVGLVGAELLHQLSQPQLASKFRLVFVSNSKHSVSSLAPNVHKLDLTNWKQALSESTALPALEHLPRILGEFVTNDEKNPFVVVDNTSSEAVALLYPKFLRAGVSVVTPNKKAFSGDLWLYDDILASSALTGAKFLNEATVGAGLPIIATLKDLVATGDKARINSLLEVKKIEGVLSGTLSYIFNEYSTSKGGSESFSTVVRVAKEKGFTEPHPGDDLNGADVARKLTILSRMIPSLRNNLHKGYESVSTTSLVPDILASPEVTGTDFLQHLPDFDSHFAKMKDDALKDGKVLRYAGVVDVEKGEIRASLEQYPIDHPFATSLGGSDNIIAFHTERYSPRPLIVQGAGAGAAVTAMGVLSDLLKLC